MIIETEEEYNLANSRFWELVPSVMSGDKTNLEEFEELGKALALYEIDCEIFRIILEYENS